MAARGEFSHVLTYRNDLNYGWYNDQGRGQYEQIKAGPNRQARSKNWKRTVMQLDGSEDEDCAAGEDDGGAQRYQAAQDEEGEEERPMIVNVGQVNKSPAHNYSITD